MLTASHQCSPPLKHQHTNATKLLNIFQVQATEESFDADHDWVQTGLRMLGTNTSNSIVLSESN